MDLNTLLLWFVGFSCGSLLYSYSTLRTKARPSGWVVVSGCVLAFMGLTWLWRPGLAGYLGGSAWIVLLVIPMQAGRLRRRYTMQYRPRAALACARVAAWLHPFDGQPTALRLARYWMYAFESDDDDAMAQLERLRGAMSQAVLDASLMGLRRQWTALIAFARHVVGEESLETDGALTTLYLRAMGETGDLRSMLTFYSRIAARETRPKPARRLAVLAFTGQTADVQRLFAGPLKRVPRTFRERWLAIAEFAGGQRGEAEARLRGLSARASKGLRVSIERRLAQPPAVARDLLGEAELSRLVRQLHDLERSAPAATPTELAALATWALIALNVLYYGVEAVCSLRMSPPALGGWMHRLGQWLGRVYEINDAVLERLGGLDARYVAAGQWQRLLSANFLHAGVLHLGMNMLGLALLGPLVERTMGRARFVALYLLSGIGAMGLFIMMQRYGMLDYELLIGASGAIMGVLGALVAGLLQGEVRRDPDMRARLKWALMIIVVQMVFDALTPEVSSTAHIGGLVCGFLLGLLLQRRRPASSDSSVGVRQSAA